MKKQEKIITEETRSYLISVFSEICNSKGGSSYCAVDGRTYYTDWGYGIEGIACFLDIISRRNGLGSFDCGLIDCEDDEQ